MYPSYLKASKSPLRPARTCGLPIEVNMYFFFLYMLYWYRAVYSHRFSWFWAWWKVKLTPLLGIATTACFVICCSFEDVGTRRICCSALLNNTTLGILHLPGSLRKNYCAIGEARVGVHWFRCPLATHVSEERRRWQRQLFYWITRSREVPSRCEILLKTEGRYA